MTAVVGRANPFLQNNLYSWAVAISHFLILLIIKMEKSREE